MRWQLCLAVCSLLAACPSSPELPTDGCGPSQGHSRIRLLTRDELDRTVRDLLLDDSRPARRLLPPESTLVGFEGDANHHRATPLLVGQHLHFAEEVAGRAIDRYRELVPCPTGSSIGRDCAEAIIESIGTRAFRRPPTIEERERLLAIFDVGVVEAGPRLATERLLTSILMSPSFLYLVDKVGPDGRLDGWSVASRLSYLLWGSMPDEELLAAAARGDLDTAPGIERQARRMVLDERARDASTSFFRQWLGLSRLESTTKDVDSFPSWSPDVNAAWAREVLNFTNGVMWSGNGSLEELFMSSHRIGEPLLQGLYGQDGPRNGLVAQPGLMALLATPTSSSPVRRGVFVRERLLCQPLSPPPPDVGTAMSDPNPGLTTRERTAAHSTNPRCAGCHLRIDPIGFGLESLDAVGRHRTTENGHPIDDRGELLFTGDPSAEGVFRGAGELGDLLARSGTVRDCVVRQAFTFSMGRLPDEHDVCELQGLRRSLNDGGLRELFVGLATSESLRTGRLP